ncbi:MAG: tRNA (adenosine(37)-N6)-threonylcarbamoyltransferase complex ATPase subunit type 1 TsaE [Candidatus Taylorbacteria bacterium CG11_big_fil_rev_8_21_14_0_20_46_11]|uniref:tRNA threonylcarbamoyladenosine biosynthesis protein TsaE n=1 Tax=Candidatus Taylorbacteria bacterium CG11_big_fil_rev_8_21_14_0_20_46_11 TaxID=1975025 RepID=A0A2H0KBY5_9BACT|nr:MAG: tRNA (adenosine(37)-N6)-threonylcarbamoyltransferase complex ATPase subunit type 1 TsaE [Candidatus Taylorbacteria bacterium CG11_big_fil_rev_8_21_14_0_20_46_11]
MQSKTASIEDFQKVARDFAGKVTPVPGRATVIGLYGNLGAGKTTFVQAVAKALGVIETVNSPTFLIYKTYNLQPATNNRGFGKLVHIDAYRLKGADELRQLRFDELLPDPKNLILIEWADKVSDILPPDHTKLSFEFVDDTTRTISFS